MAASAEKAEHARQVARGRAERKIVDADMEYVNSLDSKALSAYLDHTAPKFPAPMPKNAPERTEPDSAALSAEEESTIRTMNLDRNEYLKLKKGNL